MQELVPGIFHWRVVHPHIQIEVDSYYIPALDPACLIDPLIPHEGLDWFRNRPTPAHIYLTNRLHDRQSAPFKKAFGARSLSDIAAFYCGERSVARCVVLGPKKSSMYSSEYTSGFSGPAASHRTPAPSPRHERQCRTGS
jgi:hypothetical protein